MNNENLLQTIAKQAHEGQTSTKPILLENFLNLFETNEDLLNQVNEAQPQLLATLYKYLSPAKSKLLKQPIDILKQTMAVNDVRYFLNYIYVSKDESDIVSANGHMISKMPNTLNLTHGFYDRNLIQIDVDGTFPDYNQVINKKENTIEVELKDCTLEIDKKRGVEKISIPTGFGYDIHFNFGYVKRVMGKNFQKFSLSFNDKASSGTFINPDFPEVEIIIMPIKA